MKNGRISIGVLADYTSTIYHRRILTGIETYAVERDINLFYYVGGNLESPYIFEFQKTAVFDLVHRNRVDGLIVLTPTVGVYVDHRKKLDFCLKFSPIPFISLGLALENIPSVTIDNRKGMNELVDHLAGVHAYGRIAFIHGPQNNEDAAVRHTVFKEAMHRNRVPILPELAVTGNYTVACGEEAVRTLLHERKTGFDAIVAPNDDAALGVIRQCVRENIIIPFERAVTGFDDNFADKVNFPGLTTVRQPLEEYGRTGCELIVRKALGEDIPIHTVLESRLTLRESCGCMRKNLSWTGEEIPAWGGTLESVIQSRYADRVGDGKAAELLKAALAAFSGCMDQAANAPFVRRWLDFAQNRKPDGADRGVLHEILHSLHEFTAGTVREPGTVRRLSALLYQTLLYTENLLRKSTPYDFELDDSNVFIIRDLNELLHVTLQPLRLSQLMDVVFDRLVAGIASGYLAVFEKPQVDRERARLLLAWSNGKRLATGDGTPFFPSRKMVPDEYLPPSGRHSFVIQSLHYGNEHIGYILFEVNGWRNTMFESLASIISSSLKNGLLFSEIEKLTSNIGQILQNKTEELKKTNRKLEQEVKKLQDTVTDRYRQSEYGTFKDLRIQKAIVFIEQHYNDPLLSLENAADAVFVEKTYFSKLFKESTGRGFLEYLTEYRLAKARTLLKTTPLSITEIAQMVGYPNGKYFYALFKKHTSLTPGDYRNER